MPSEETSPPVPLTLHLRPELLDQLKAIAEMRRLSPEQLTQQVLNDFCMKQQNQNMDTAVFYRHAEDELQQFLDEDLSRLRDQDPPSPPCQ